MGCTPSTTCAQDCVRCADNWDSTCGHCGVYGQQVTSNCGDSCRNCMRCLGQSVQGVAVLVLTHWFNSGLLSKSDCPSIIFSGRRVDTGGPPERADTFTQEERLDDITPESGPTSVTARVYGINPGCWIVTAKSSGGKELGEWSGKVPAKAIMASSEPVETDIGMAHFTQTGVPGVIGWAWLASVALAVAIGVVFQGAILAHEHIEIGAPLLLSIFALPIGCLGAKIWFVVKHHYPWRAFISSGMCVQGFLTGVALVSLVGLPLAHIPVNAFCRAMAPSLFFGLAIGRIGCFFAGCCAGRPTNSRWGIWSSDGRLGARRVPTQLLESVVSLLIGVVALSLQHILAASGATLVACWIAYTMFRGSLVFPLRAEYRASSARLRLAQEASGDNSTLSQSIVQTEACGSLHDQHMQAKDESRQLA